jgi:nicotinamide mononucleotide transporter
MTVESSLFQDIFNAVIALPPWEMTASLLGIIYVILAARESFWCWPFAFVSTLIYTLLFWEGQLPMQALLNFYYMGMAIYGFLLWRHHGDAESDLHISRWPIRNHFAIIVTGSLLSFAVGTYMESISASKAPYLDAAVMVFSVLNTWLMAKKVLENWLYWIVIDTAAIILFIQTGYYATIGMMVVYIVLAVFGFIGWKRNYDQSLLTAA